MCTRARFIVGGLLLAIAWGETASALVIVTREGLNQPMTDHALYFLVDVNVTRTGRDNLILVRFYNQAGAPFQVAEKTREHNPAPAPSYAGSRDKVRSPRRASWIVKNRDGSVRCDFRIDLREDPPGQYTAEAKFSHLQDLETSYLRVEFELEPTEGGKPSSEIFEFKLSDFVNPARLDVKL